MNKRESLTIDPFQILPIPQSTPTATFQASCLRSWPKPVWVPIKPKADQTPSHTVRPLLASEAMLGLRDVVKDKNTLFKHSSALICSALNADVIGGYGDGEARGGKDRAVGCIRVRSGSTSVVRKVVFECWGESVSIWAFISTSTSSWSANSRSSRRIDSNQRNKKKKKVSSYLHHHYCLHFQEHLVQDLVTSHTPPSRFPKPTVQSVNSTPTTPTRFL